MSLFNKIENGKCLNTLCPLFEKYDQVVTGAGNVNADIMFVGDSPGATDMASKMLLQGNVGRVLKELLNEAGIPEERCYFTNVLYCRSDNAKTVPAAIKACAAYLDDEIFKVKPKIIVPLGNVALERIQGLKGITRHRGKVLVNPRYKAKVIATMHPASVFRVEENRVKIKKDLKRVAQELRIERTGSLKGDYKVIKTVKEAEELRDTLAKAEEFTFDIETDDLNFLKGSVLGIAFSHKEQFGRYLPFLGDHAKDHTKDLWLPEEKKQIFEIAKAILSNKSKKIAHNGKFDCKFLRKMGLEVNNFYFDTMLAHHLLDENESHGLKDLAVAETDLGGYENALDPYLPTKAASYRNIPLDILGKYAGLDADCTLRLKKKFEPRLKDQGLTNVFNIIVMPSSKLLTDVEYSGICIDKEYLLALREQYQTKMLILEEEFKEKHGEGININSTKQLRELFFKTLNLRPAGRTPTKRPSTDHKSLIELAKQHEAPKLILEHRKLSKVCSTFIVGLLEVMDHEGRVHTDYIIIGTVTGRLSSKKPNLQNIPNTEEIRKIFVPVKGSKFIVADFSQMELRVMCEYSADTELLEAFKRGEDIHSLVASRVLKIPQAEVTAKQRSLAKGIVFGLIYGRGSKSVAEELGLSIIEAERFINQFFAEFPTIRSWMEKQKRLARKQGYVTNLFGRRRRLPEINSQDIKKASSAARQSMNSVVQGGASDITCLSAIRVMERLKESGLKTRLVLNVHDELVFECPEDEIKEAQEIVLNTMEYPFSNPEFFKIPLKVDLKVTDCWI